MVAFVDIGAVLAGLVYCILQFRSAGPGEDGPPIKGTNWVPKVWLGLSTMLAATVMISPL